MVRKKLAMAVLALSALQADLACALGLGNLSVKSALNQPLNAEIRLLDTGDLDPSQIKVQLAAPEDFERAGVDRNFFLTNLKFTVDMDGRGTGVIRISTRDAVVEPYLNFVVEAKWPNGRLLREFAVLLDPPTFSAGAAALPAQAAPTPRPTRQLQPPTVSATPAVPSTAEKLESNTLREAAGASEHRVQVNETLGQIAARHRPATDISVQQTMVAIQRANPDAFIQNNINLIKSGAVLRLPSADDARAIANGEATAAVTEQTHSWRGGAAGAGTAEPASGPQLDASQAKTTEATGPHEKERLTIATPGNSDKSTAGEGSGKSSKGLDALRNQLTASQEGLDSAKRDNKELQSRLDDMERQVATLQRLISLKDDQLTALQAKSAQSSQQATATPVTAPAPAESKEPVAQAPVAEQPAVATTTAPTPVAPTPPAPTPAVPPTTPKVAPKPAPEPSFLSHITSNPLYLGGLAALAALLVGGGVLLKKRREQAEEESAYQDLDLDDYTAESDVAVGDVDLDHALVSDDAIVDSTEVSESVASVVDPEKKPLRSETGDAIAEADIYVAYGRYQQAVDLLTSAIDAEPDRADLRVKLLEVYLEMRNRDAFRQQFMSLQGLGDSEAVVRVKEMLSSVDGVSDWLSDLPQPTNTSSSTSDLGALGGAAIAGATTAFAAESFSSDHNVAVDDGELDLDLDLDSDFPEAMGDFTATVAPQDAYSQFSTPQKTLPSEPLDDLELDLDEVTSESLNDLYLGEFDKDQVATDLATGDTFSAFNNPAHDEVSSESLNDLYVGELDKGEVSTNQATDDTFGGFAEPAPAFDPFAANSEAENEAMELELDEEELDLDLNEEDLDFALRAMEGDVAAPVPTPAFDAPAFETPEFEAPVFETPALNASNNQKDAADDLHDFDLSLADEEFANTSEERKALEADLGDLSELEGLGDLDGLEDLSFETPAPASHDAFTTPLSDRDTTVLDEPFADLQEHVPSFAPAAPSADGDDFDFLADTDEVATKLDLARAYIDMGDTDGAKDILDEVLHEGSDVQKQEASELLGRIA